MYAARRTIDIEKIFARSFTRQEHKTLTYGAFIGCFIMALNLCTVLIILKPYLRLPLNYYHDAADSTMMKPIVHNLSNHRSDAYEVEGDIRIQGNSSTIFIASHHINSTCWTIKPYAQKMNTAKFRSVTTFTIKLQPPHTIPQCTLNLHHIPAVLFSGKGHALNLFHAFADVLFPLFLTSHPFNRSIIFLVTNHYSPWTSRYRAIIKKLSQYDVVDVDTENQVLCFSKMFIGLKTPGALFIHPEESRNFSIGSFRKLVRSAYSMQREYVRRTEDDPRLLIISREGSRRLTNEGQIGKMARRLGFQVVIKRMAPNAPMGATARHVNSFDVVVGVHGAGLTNMVFLAGEAVLVQIIPYGLEVEAYVCYEWPAVSMGLRYLEYKVGWNESSLRGEYGGDSDIYRDPGAIREKQNDRFRRVYLDNQDVAPDVDSFKKTLLRALDLLISS